MTDATPMTRKESLGKILGEAIEANAGEKMKTEFFNFHVPDEAWRTVDMPSDGGPNDFPDVIREKVDLHEYFYGRLDTSVPFNSDNFSVLLMRLAPGFTIPRHSHETDQVVIVLEGEARQGNRVFKPGDAYFTPGNQPYSLTAGPEGCRTVEVRKHSLHELQTHWHEAKPERWDAYEAACTEAINRDRGRDDV
jgi:quercetin dioxygenase-like cupin family protein